MIRPTIQHLLFGFAYFLTASVTIAVTRLDGGVAFFWIATALLTAKLRTTHVSDWGGWFVAAAAGSMLATGLVGLGWTASPGMMAVNMLDALLAERVLTYVAKRRGALSLERDGPMIALACLCGAVVTMAPAAIITYHATGTPISSTAANWVIGHTVGSLAFGPFMHLCMQGQMRQWLARVFTGRDRGSLIGVLLLAGTSIAAFGHGWMALLFLPVLALAALTHRAGLQGAAFGGALLSLIGAWFMLAPGAVPASIVLANPPILPFHFFLFFLACTTLAMLPIAAAISARKDMFSRLQISEDGYRLLADNVDDVVVSLDLRGRLTYVSPSIRNFSGQSPAEVVGSTALGLIDPAYHARARRGFARIVAARGSPLTFEFLGVAEGSQTRWFEMRGRSVRDDSDGPPCVIGTIRETTARKMLETALTSATAADPLTGLLNRRAFLNAATIIAGGGTESWVAVFDLDYLNAINTMIGNDAGDEVLVTFARTASLMLRERDLLGRLEDDAFALLLPNTTGDQAEAVCRRLLAAFAGARLNYHGRALEISASAGLAPLDTDLATALRTARSAAGRSKATGRANLTLVA